MTSHTSPTSEIFRTVFSCFLHSFPICFKHQFEVVLASAWAPIGRPWHLHLRQVLRHASIAHYSALGRELIGFLVGLFLEEAVLVVIPKGVRHGSSWFCPLRDDRSITSWVANTSTFLPSGMQMFKIVEVQGLDLWASNLFLQAVSPNQHQTTADLHVTVVHPIFQP